MSLYRPDRAAFAELSHAHRVVPVWREVLADLDTPLGVYDRLRQAGGPTFLLESVEHGQRWGRYSFIGLRPFLEMAAADGRVWLDGAVPAEARTAAATGDPLATLEVLLEALEAPQLDGLPPLFCGAVGYLGWDVVRFIEELPAAPPDDLGLEVARMMFPGQLVAFDHLRQRLLVVSNVVVGDDPAADYERAVSASEELVARLARPVVARPVAPPAAAEVGDAEANMARGDYLAAVARAKAHIAAGDIFQVVPSQRFALETDADPFTVYRVLRVINPSPYMYLFDWPGPDGAADAEAGGVQIVGSSPEALVTLAARTAAIWPIAGSRPRGRDERQDAALAASLLADDKERAEHVMLVDLARNDLGRVAELGSVRVTELMSLVRYSHIMHLHSEVTATVRAGIGAVDVLRATFPAGTLSGAPKVRAMEIIDDLEPTRRGPYGGGIGYLSLGGDMDLCIAIRTLVFTGGRAYVQAGAGLVADSVAETEYEETRNKAMALLAAVRCAEQMSAPSQSSRP